MGSCAWEVQPWGWAAMAGLALLLGLLTVLVVWIYQHRGAVETEVAAEVRATADDRDGSNELSPGGRGGWGVGCLGRLLGSAEWASPEEGASRDPRVDTSVCPAPTPAGTGEHRPLLMSGEVPPDVSL